MSVLNVIESYNLKKERKEAVPQNYLSVSMPWTSYGDINQDVFSRFLRIPNTAPIMAVNFGVKSFRVRQPIKVCIYRDGEFYFAENETLVLYGVGKSVMEAIEDFRQHVVHFWTYYNNLTWKQVSGDAVRLKRIYANLLVEE